MLGSGDGGMEVSRVLQTEGEGFGVLGAGDLDVAVLGYPRVLRRGSGSIRMSRDWR